MKNKNLSPERAIKIYKLNIFTITLFIFVIGGFLLPKNIFASEITAEKLVKLTNQERIKSGLKPLAINMVLENAARNKATDLLVDQYFSHSSLKGEKFVKWINEAGYKYLYAGENLAMDFHTAEGLINAWMKSKTHRENILSPNYTEIGIAVKSGLFKKKPTIMVAQIFGQPKIINNSKNLMVSNINNIKNNDTSQYDKNSPNMMIAGVSAKSLNAKENKYSKIPIIYFSLVALYLLVFLIFIAVDIFYKHLSYLILSRMPQTAGYQQ